MNAPLLSTQALRVDVHDPQGSRTLINSLDLTLQPGEILAILGRNGVGKSTLLATLAGLRTPAAGEVRLWGQRYTDLSPRQAAQQRGWLAQSQHDPFATSALETVLSGRHPWLERFAWESAEDKAIALRALEDVGMAGFAQRNINTLSGGERQRVNIATLLAQQPQLYLLDEPLSYLDLNHQIAVLDLFRQRAQAGACVVMVLHDPNLARRYADHILLVGEHGESCCDRTELALTPGILSRLYGHPLREIGPDDQRWFVPE